MSKGVYRSQTEHGLSGPSIASSYSSSVGDMNSYIKGVFRDSESMTSSRAPLVIPHEQRRNVDFQQHIDHFHACSEDDTLENSTKSYARSSSSNPGGEKGASEISVVPSKVVKIVIDDAATPAPTPEKPSVHPQESMSKFWNNFEPEFLGKVTRILPTTMIESTPATSKSAGETAHHAFSSYAQARDRCIRDVKRIIQECRSLNQKYTDTHFDIERDLKITRRRNCLDGLVMDGKKKAFPADVKRVHEIFESPTFFADGASFDDIIQGDLGDCWLLAAFSILTCNEQLVRDVCVIQDAEVGIYGFVFFRDGEWHQSIIDDKLYLRAPSYDESGDVVLGMYGVQQRDQEQSYNDMFQKGSKSLIFAQARNENETWVPLLEKAFAKAHGSYHSLIGGQTGEAIEDLTGGVTTEIYTTNILNKDEFWYNELRRIGKDFVFSGGVAAYREWRGGGNPSVRTERRKGIVSAHAYAILDTYEGHGQRLVKMRNPWGSQEWNGAWSDGSKEWNAEWFERLNHKFGDDGIFWISYADLLKQYKYLDRTRIFGPEWHVAQQWTSVQVPWNTTDYQQQRFQIEVPAETEAVVVLSQLDDRYFKGLQGKYNYTLQFRVQKDDADEDEYVARSPHTYELVRSANVEVKLHRGKYTVLFKVEAQKTGRQDIEEVIRDNIWRKEKLMQVGTLYDLAHQKGQSNLQSTPSVAPAPAAEDAAKPIDDKDPNRDPWNAACVVGLRVYSKQPDLGLKVVIAGQENTVAPTLDRDDIAKAALEEAQANSESGPVESALNTSSVEQPLSEEEKPEAEESSAEPKPEHSIQAIEPGPHKPADDNTDAASSVVEVEHPDDDMMSVISGTNTEMDDLAGDKATSRRWRSTLCTERTTRKY